MGAVRLALGHRVLALLLFAVILGAKPGRAFRSAITIAEGTNPISFDRRPRPSPPRPR